mgnify:CR=1 FL=1
MTVRFFTCLETEVRDVFDPRANPKTLVRMRIRHVRAGGVGRSGAGRESAHLRSAYRRSAERVRVPRSPRVLRASRPGDSVTLRLSKKCLLLMQCAKNTQQQRENHLVPKHPRDLPRAAEDTTPRPRAWYVYDARARRGVVRSPCTTSGSSTTGTR